MSECIICGCILSESELNRYVKCHNCGSYIYIGDDSSAELNKNFYNTLAIDEYNVDIIKKNIFYLFKSLDKVIRKQHYDKFDSEHAVVGNLLNNKQMKILEIGFGLGENLFSILKNGCDACGIDISEANVNNFKTKYPQYADRVSCATRIDKSVDVVYSSALFEHLDSPQDFFNNINATISDDGIVILDNIPIVNELEFTVPPQSDICFWNGIHKAIYTKKAISDFASGNGFHVLASGEFDYYTYRVLTAMKHFGYDVIEDVRHPFMSGRGLPSVFEYLRVCLLATRMNSPALLGFVALKKA